MKIDYSNNKYPIEINFDINNNILEVWDGCQDMYITNLFKYFSKGDWYGVTSKGELFSIVNRDDLDKLNKLYFIIENKKNETNTYEVLKNIRIDLHNCKYEFVNDLMLRTTNFFTLIQIMKSTYQWNDLLKCWNEKVEYLKKIFDENEYLDKEQIQGLDL